MLDRARSSPVLRIDNARPPRRSDAGAALTITDLHMSFGAVEVLAGVSLDVAAGEFVAIIGRSGCGKSTLLRLLAGLETPTRGAIEVGTQGGHAPAPVRIMFQEPRLLPWKTVIDNVAVGLASTPIKSREQRETMAAAALARVGLAERRGEWPAVLSGGQRQRVALARALVSHPAILALDEPLGALDALTRIEMQRLVEDVWRDEQFTAVLVTHDVAEAVTLADRIILLDGGRIALDIVVDLPRPRDRGSPRYASLQREILDRLLGHK